MDRHYHLNGATKPPLRRFADLSGPEFYPTPAWATFALLELEKFKGTVWECACGDGAMSTVLEEAGSVVESSDLHNRGYGESGHDFLTTKRRFPNIVTNPPFHSAGGFVLSGLEHAERKFALLLRLAFLESAARYHDIFRARAPARVWAFSERVTFYPSGVKTGGTGTTAYAWFVWDKDAPSRTELGWIEPGAKDRYAAVRPISRTQPGARGSFPAQ